MIIYFAESATSYIEPMYKAGVKNYLVSFYYQKKQKLIEKILEFEPKAKIFFDSGAYSAKTHKESIDMKEYVEYIKMYSDKLETIASLDIIGDEEQTKKNYDIMREMNLTKKLIPVFHGTENRDYLKYYCSKSNYVAIGALTSLAFEQRKLFNMIGSILNEIPKNIKVHLFGVTSNPILMRYGNRLYSVDSSSGSGEIVYRATPNLTGMMKFTPGMQYKITVEDALNLQVYACNRMLKMEQEVNDYWSMKDG